MTNRNWNKRFRDLSSEMEKEAAARLAAEREKAGERGKEPFCLDKLETRYRPVRHLLASLPRAARARELEAEYYLLYPEVMTLEEFARAIQKTDAFDEGGLGRDWNIRESG